LGSALSWACANVAIQGASRRVGSWSALVWAQVVGGVIALAVGLVLEGVPSVDALRSGGLFVVGAGVAAAVAYGGLFESLRRGQVAIVAPIISAWSVGSVLVVSVQGQPPTVVVAVGVAMVVLGNALVARSTGGPTDTPRTTPRSAIVWAALSACGFAVMVPLLSQAGERVGRVWTIPLVWVVELSLLVPLLLRLRLLKVPDADGDWFAVARAAGFEVGGFICLSIGLGSAPVSIVSPVASLSTAGSVALGLLLLEESVARSALLGAMLASAGVVVINL
jgi:drug/metabolite transporter (DMT)-like permease